MMISLFFPFIFLKTPPIISGFFSDPPSRGVYLSKENIIAPPPPNPFPDIETSRYKTVFESPACLDGKP